MSEKIRVFNENDVRDAMFGKVPYRKKHRGSKHDKLDVYLDDVFIKKIKVPNDHRKPFGRRKAHLVKTDLLLKTNEEYNRFVDCDMRSREYGSLLQKRASQ